MGRAEERKFGSGGKGSYGLRADRVEGAKSQGIFRLMRGSSKEMGELLGVTPRVS